MARNGGHFHRIEPLLKQSDPASYRSANIALPPSRLYSLPERPLANDDQFCRVAGIGVQVAEGAPSGRARRVRRRLLWPHPYRA